MLNLRLRSFVGSTREVQSPDVGGTSIHSSRWGLDESFAAAASAAESKGSCWRWFSKELGSWVGSEGPNSSSEEDGGVLVGVFTALGGNSVRGAGGREGPRIRRRLELEDGAGLGDWLGGLGGGFVVACSSSSCWRLRLARR